MIILQNVASGLLKHANVSRTILKSPTMGHKIEILASLWVMEYQKVKFCQNLKSQSALFQLGPVFSGAYFVEQETQNRCSSSSRSRLISSHKTELRAAKANMKKKQRSPLQ
jgi:hypothetical protein